MFSDIRVCLKTKNERWKTKNEGQFSRGGTEKPHPVFGPAHTQLDPKLENRGSTPPQEIRGISCSSSWLLCGNSWFFQSVSWSKNWSLQRNQRTLSHYHLPQAAGISNDNWIQKKKLLNFRWTVQPAWTGLKVHCKKGYRFSRPQPGCHLFQTLPGGE
jgi:hypothetical protein